VRDTIAYTYRYADSDCECHADGHSDSESHTNCHANGNGYSYSYEVLPHSTAPTDSSTATVICLDGKARSCSARSP
jgi:hypothetical protein